MDTTDKRRERERGSGEPTFPAPFTNPFLATHHIGTARRDGPGRGEASTPTLERAATTAGAARLGKGEKEGGRQQWQGKKAQEEGLSE